MSNINNISPSQNREQTINNKIDHAKVDKISTEFEEVFLSKMLSICFENVRADPLVEDKGAGKIYNQLRVEQFAKIVSESGGVGIADNIRAELIKTQEILNNDN